MQGTGWESIRDLKRVDDHLLGRDHLMITWLGMGRSPWQVTDGWKSLGEPTDDSILNQHTTSKDRPPQQCSAERNLLIQL